MIRTESIEIKEEIEPHQQGAWISGKNGTRIQVTGTRNRKNGIGICTQHKLGNGMGAKFGQGNGVYMYISPFYIILGWVLVSQLLMIDALL